VSLPANHKQRPLCLGSNRDLALYRTYRRSGFHLLAIGLNNRCSRCDRLGRGRRINREAFKTKAGFVITTAHFCVIRVSHPVVAGLVLVFADQLAAGIVLGQQPGIVIMKVHRPRSTASTNLIAQGACNSSTINRYVPSAMISGCRMQHLKCGNSSSGANLSQCSR